MLKIKSYWAILALLAVLMILGGCVSTRIHNADMEFIQDQILDLTLVLEYQQAYIEYLENDLGIFIAQETQEIEDSSADMDRPVGKLSKPIE